MANDGTRAAIQRDLAKFADLDLFAEFFASNMAAGPCPRAAALHGRRMPASEAPVPPLPECTHPDQCGGMYLSRLALDGEF